MNRRVDTNRILDAYLAPEADRLPDRVIDTALAHIARTPQRRALRVPWRFRLMTSTMRAAVALVAIVAIVGAGLLAFNNVRSSGAGGISSAPTLSPAATSPAPSLTPAPSPASPAPSQVAPGVTAWTPYTSAAYGITFGIPDGWTVYAPATRKWKTGDATAGGSSPYADIFVNPNGRDGDDIGLFIWQVRPARGADITSREGLAAWARAKGCDPAIDVCATVPDIALPMCVGQVACGPAILVPFSDGTAAFLGGDLGPTDGLITIVALGRPDKFPAAARYGGGVQLIKSILSTMDVWTPQPGQIPAGG